MDNFRRRTSGSDKVKLDPVTGRGMIGDYEVVDLGLPSGLLWATWNVGATKESEYGDYYMYGKGSRQYNFGDIHYEGTEDPLASSADTATQVMGDGWRMPTKDELQELFDNTDVTPRVVINGAVGSKFTSKTNPNAYVLLPFAGSYQYRNLDSKYTNGYVWSSTPINNRNAYSIYFSNGGAYSRGVTNSSRNVGLSVRGVYSPS